MFAEFEYAIFDGIVQEAAQDWRFEYDTSKSLISYNCEIRNAYVVNSYTTMLISRQHEYFKCDNDITATVFKESVIHFFPRVVFYIFPNLEFLRLSSVGLKSLPTLESCGKLRYLDLSRNSLSVIDPNSFTECSSLSYLLMDRNKIKLIQANAFHSPSNVNWMNLQFNGLDTMPRNFFKSFELINLLDLAGNTDCGNDQFKKITRYTSYTLEPKFVKCFMNYDNKFRMIGEDAENLNGTELEAH